MTIDGPICVLSMPGLGARIRSEEMIEALRRIGRTVCVPAGSRIPLQSAGLLVSHLRKSATLMGLPDDFLRILTIARDPRLAYSWARAFAAADKAVTVARTCTLIIAESTLMGVLARIVSTTTGVPYILDLHGLYAMEHVGEKGTPVTALDAELDVIERTAISEATKVITVSRSMRDYVCSHYNRRNSDVVVHINGGRIYRRSARYGKPLHFVFGGAFSYWERPQDFITLARVAADCDRVFDIFGDGPLRGEIINDLSANPLKISLGNLMTREAAFERFSESQVGVAPSSTDLVRRVAWPIKVMDYASCGLPVIAQKAGEWSDAITEYGFGEVVNFSDTELLRDTVDKISNKATWQAMSRNSIEAVSGPLSWENAFRRLGETISI